MKKKIFNFLLKNRDSLREVVQATSDVLEAASEFKKNPNPFSKFRILATATYKIIDTSEACRKIFTGSGYLNIDCFFYIFFDFFDDVEERASDGLMFKTIRNKNYCISSWKQVNQSPNIYIERGSIEDFKKDISKNITQKLGKYLILDGSGENVVLQKDRYAKPIKNAIADEISANLQKWKDAKESYSILLHGPPGVGKSTIARTIGSTFDGCITLRGISENPDMLYEIEKYLEIFQSNLIIIEDIDRIQDTEALMNTMEQLKGGGKYIIATANKFKKLDSALVRPGRFDKVMKISSVDEKVIREMVGDDKDIYKIAKEFSTAEVAELMRRVRVLGKEEALQNCGDLVERSLLAQKEYEGIEFTLPEAEQDKSNNQDEMLFS